MKKIITYLIIFMCILFIFPALFTKTKAKADITNLNNETIINPEDLAKHDYSKYNTIKLLHSKTGEIEEVPFDEYLYCTVSAEMPVDYEIEALKAQAIVSRTYTIYQIEHNNKKHGDADICDNYACCQAWISKGDRIARWNQDVAESNWNKIVKAVNDTSGMVATYNGEAINAFFHSSSGGITETVSNVWGGRDFPYLQIVETAGETEYEGYSSEVIFSKVDLVNKLKEYYTDIEINFDLEDAISILAHTESRKS